MGDRNELTFNIIVAAVEGGINYWALTRNYRWDLDTDVASVEVCEDGSNAWTVVDQAWVERALEAIRNERREIELRDDILSAILLADRTNGRQGDIDAEAADCVIQLGLFGEVVYG